MSNPLLDLMHRGESGAAGYNAYNRGTYYDAAGKSHIRPADRPIDFSKLTVGQLRWMQDLPDGDPNRVFAVGKYQIIPRTLAGAVASMNLSPDMPFTPELQDRILFDYLIVQKRPGVHDYIAGKPGATLREAQFQMACEWASFGDPTKGGASHYPPPNHASISLAQSQAALDTMRESYRAAISRGLTPDAAWRAATGGGEQRSQCAPSPPPTIHESTGRSRDAVPKAEGLVTLGAHGPDVRALQITLDRLGYKDAHGREIVADGKFGQRTLEALQAFQRDHGLNGKGIAGPLTQKALQESSLALVTSPSDPHHPLYEQTLAKVREAELARGIAPGPHSERIAAVLTTELLREGITRVDRVEFNRDGSLVRAVQVSPLRDEPGLNRSTDAVSTQQASVQSIAESSRQMHEVAVNVRAQRQDPQFTQQHAAGPAVAH